MDLLYDFVSQHLHILDTFNLVKQLKHDANKIVLVCLEGLCTCFHYAASIICVSAEIYVKV